MTTEAPAGARLALPEGAGRFYRHGWHSWSVTGWVDRYATLRRTPVPEYRVMGDDPGFPEAERLGGSGLGGYEGADGDTLVLGSLGLDGRVSVEDGELVGRGPAAWRPYRGSRTRAFGGYAADLGEVLGARPADPGPVWCSWYSYGTGITSALMGEVIDGLGDLPFTVIQIDDGWQVAIGDWAPGPSFPEGMQAAAERIRRTGRRAGLWLAPFLADARSDLAGRHPEMLLRDSGGSPVEAAFNWGGPAYALDVTCHDTLEQVGSGIRLALSWGFDYLKLDFLYAAALPGVRPDGIGREAAYRMGIEAIRRAAGDECLLLACGAPIVASLGVFDAIRIGPDTAPYWENADRVRYLGDRAGPGLADAIATSVNRLWLRELIGLDPDVAFFRSRHCLLTSEQRRLGADLARICGFRATSDPPGWLDPDERRELEDFLAGRPVVEQVAAYRFVVDGRDVDLTEIVGGRPW
ncbi:MAG: alpha-galactosidase [Acidimicrobiia bacterium]